MFMSDWSALLTPQKAALERMSTLLKSSRIYFDNPSSSRDKTILSGTTPLGALFYLLHFADFSHQIIVDLLQKTKTRNQKLVGKSKEIKMTKGQGKGNRDQKTTAKVYSFNYITPSKPFLSSGSGVNLPICKI